MAFERVQNKQSKRREKVRFFISLGVAILITLASWTGWMDSTDYAMADTLYQSADHYDENILVIGIDSYALEELGAWPWTRDMTADLLYMINGDPDNMPAAIGVDILFVSENDPWADAYLVDAASAGNVVMAGGVDFTTSLAEEDGKYYMDEFSIASYNFPFDALREVTTLGHSNAMLDSDGILRHHLWSVPSEDGGEVLSLPYQLYAMYCENQGIEASFDPDRSERGFWWVDYGAEPGAYYTYSAADILYGDFDSELLKDAIVLIGPYDAGLSDDYLTAVDHAYSMFGVEYMANVTSAMIRGANKIEIPVWVQQVAIFAFVFCCVMVFTHGAMRWTWLLAIGLIAFSIFANVAIYQHLDIVLMPLWPVVGVGFGWIVSVAEHYSVAKLEQRRIANTFQHYVDPQIMKELLKGGEEALYLGGRTVDIAVLFVDIRGFTTMSEKLEPEKVVEILNEYLTLTSQCIKKTHGTLDKFVGDCTMAFWGAPLPCDEPIYKACVAAMAMVEGAKPLEERLFQLYGHHVSFGVGVNYGPAVVGNIGAVDRMDYTAIGDTVNTSARLEANAPAGKVYISRIVADALGDRATTTSLGGTVRLKGKEEGFEILTLDSLEMPK